MPEVRVAVGGAGRLPPEILRSVVEREIDGLGSEPDVDDVLRWAVTEFRSRLAVASSKSNAVLAHLVARHLPGVDVVFLDTDLHFPETLDYRDEVSQVVAVTALSVQPELTVEEQAQRHGATLRQRHPASCCRLCNVELMDGDLRPYEAWVTGLRRAGSQTRPRTHILEWDERRGMVKLNPLAPWTHDDVSAYVVRHDLPEHPPRPLGFLSSRRAPFTRAPEPSGRRERADERSASRPRAGCMTIRTPAQRTSIHSAAEPRATAMRRTPRQRRRSHGRTDDARSLIPEDGTCRGGARDRRDRATGTWPR